MGEQAKLQIWHNGIDKVIAESAEEAQRIQLESYGYPEELEGRPLQEIAEHEGLEGDHPWRVWRSPLGLPGDPLEIWVDGPDGGQVQARKLAAEWIAECGRGFLCSSEW